MTKGMFEDEEGSAGRMGRFRRKFEELSDGGLDWVVEESVTSGVDGTSPAVGQLMSKEDEIKKLGKGGKGKKK